MGRLHRLSMLFAALIAAVAFVGHAEAATFLGHLDTDVTFGIGGDTEYDFILDQPATLSGNTVSKNFTPTIRLFELHDFTGFHELTFDILKFGQLPGGTRTWDFETELGNGSLYALSITGSGSYSGSITFTFAAPKVAAVPLAATPLPPALLMFGTAVSGFIGFGWAARRRGGFCKGDLHGQLA